MVPLVLPMVPVVVISPTVGCKFCRQPRAVGKTTNALKLRHSRWLPFPMVPLVQLAMPTASLALPMVLLVPLFYHSFANGMVIPMVQAVNKVSMILCVPLGLFVNNGTIGKLTNSTIGRISNAPVGSGFPFSLRSMSGLMPV